MNYWAPLDTINEEEETEEAINNTTLKALTTQKKHRKKWTRRQERRQRKWNEHKIIIDSGATSHFLSDEINSPNMGQLKEEVYLPDGSTLTTKYKTLLPFEQLSTEAREAAVLQGLKKSLASISKWADEGYTMIFHPGDNGVTVHKPGTLTMAFGKPPVLQGHKPSGAKLWMMTIDNNQTKSEEMSNIHNLPSTAQAIKFLHAAAGYPGNVDCSNQRGKLHNLAGINSKSSTTPLPQIR